MLSFWEYFAQSFSNPTKIIKKIKKTKTLEDFDEVIQNIFEEEMEFAFSD